MWQGQQLENQLEIINKSLLLLKQWMSLHYPPFVTNIESWHTKFVEKLTTTNTNDITEQLTHSNVVHLCAKILKDCCATNGTAPNGKVFEVRFADDSKLAASDGYNVFVAGDRYDVFALYYHYMCCYEKVGAFFTFDRQETYPFSKMAAIWNERVYDVDRRYVGPLDDKTLEKLSPGKIAKEIVVDTVTFVTFNTLYEDSSVDDKEEEY